MPFELNTSSRRLGRAGVEAYPSSAGSSGATAPPTPSARSNWRRDRPAVGRGARARVVSWLGPLVAEGIGDSDGRHQRRHLVAGFAERPPRLGQRGVVGRLLVAADGVAEPLQRHAVAHLVRAGQLAGQLQRVLDRPVAGGGAVDLAGRVDRRPGRPWCARRRCRRSSRTGCPADRSAGGTWRSRCPTGDPRSARGSTPWDRPAARCCSRPAAAAAAPCRTASPGSACPAAPATTCPSGRGRSSRWPGSAGPPGGPAPDPPASSRRPRPSRLPRPYSSYSVAADHRIRRAQQRVQPPVALADHVIDEAHGLLAHRRAQLVA